MTKLTILGGGNTAFSLAAQMAHQGHEVLLWEHLAFARSIEPLRGNPEITLSGPGGRSVERLVGVTTDPAEALAWSDLLLCSVPSYAHGPFLDSLRPHLRSGHTLCLMPGNLGSLAFATSLAEFGISGVVVVESDTAPYVCRKTGLAEATIFGIVPSIGVGVFPASQTTEVLPELQTLFPGAHAYDHVIEAGLSAMNPVVHPVGVLMNAGRIERSQGEFRFYEEGVTPAVVAVIEALDQERLAIGRALGLTLTPVAEAFHAAGFGPDGDLWSVINGSRMLTAMRAPGQVDTRWITEDVPYGLATWSEIGAKIGVDTAVMNAVITMSSAALGTDFFTQRRSLARLGLKDRTGDELLAWLEQGS